LYGISQKPDTNDYILVQNGSLIFTDCWASEDDKIDDFVHKMQLKANNHNDIVFQWIPYGQFYGINEVGNGGFAEVYSAIWMDGPLYNKVQNGNYIRKKDKPVALKCLNNSQNLIEFLNEVYISLNFY
jgi:hypothetical protein